MSRESDLIYKLDILHLQLKIAREKDYEFVQRRIEGEIARVERVLSELSAPEREVKWTTSDGITKQGH
jgi:hypothetical protein